MRKISKNGFRDIWGMMSEGKKMYGKSAKKKMEKGVGSKKGRKMNSAMAYIK